MTPELPPNPRAELEAKITAWLLGELNAAEAARVREMVEKDPELQKLRDRLSQTLNLLRETLATPAGEIATQPAPLKMSAAKREKLLATFKTIEPEEFKQERKYFTWPVVLAMAASLVLLVAVSLPRLAHSKWKKPIAETFGATYDEKKISSPEPETPVATSANSIPASADSINTPPPAAPALVAAAPPPPPTIVLPQQMEDLADGLNQTKTPAPAKSVTKIDTFVAADNSTVTSADVAPSSPPMAVAETASDTGLDRRAFKRTEQEKIDGDALKKNPSRGGEALLANRDRKTRHHAPALTPIPGIAGPIPEASGSLAANAEESGKPTADNSKLGLDNRKPGYGNASVPNNANASSQATANYFGAALSGNIAASGGSQKLEGFNAAELTILNSREGENKRLDEENDKQKPNSGLSAWTAKLHATGNSDGGGNLIAGSATTPSGMVGEKVLVDPDTRRVYRTKDKEPGQRQLAEINGAPVNTPLSGGFRFADGAVARAPFPAPVPPPEILTRTNAFSTFSLNVSDVAFKLAQASLAKGAMPDAASMRSEEFINAFDYRDPEPASGAPIGFAWERAGNPFAHDRDFIRFSVKTAAQGREANRPLNLVILLDKSGSMERADRVEMINRALHALAPQLHSQDKLSVVVFARTARLFIDGMAGSEAGNVARNLRALTPEGGTNLEEAMKLAYATALRHYLANGENRIVLLTDGAANLGNVDPNDLKKSVESNRKQGIALDCFGVGWDGYNDDLLEKLSRAGGGRYGFVNTPEEAATEFAGKLAGALRVAAADVKVQVEFNPNRVTSYRQIGYAKDQLKAEDFRNNNVKAAQIGVAESGNALYSVQLSPSGDGPIGTVHVRYRVPGTDTYEEHAWDLPYTGNVVPLDKASPALRLAATAAEFAEWMAGSPFAGEVTPDKLLKYLNGVPQVYGADARPQTLQWMIRQARSISGK